MSGGFLKNYPDYGDFNRSLEESLATNEFSWKVASFDDQGWMILEGFLRVAKELGTLQFLREPYKSIGPPPWNPPKNPRRRFKPGHVQKYFFWCNLFQREANSLTQWRVSDIKHTIIWCDRLYCGLLYLLSPYQLPYDMTIYTIFSMTLHAPLPKHTYKKTVSISKMHHFLGGIFYRSFQPFISQNQKESHQFFQQKHGVQGTGARGTSSTTPMVCCLCAWRASSGCMPWSCWTITCSNFFVAKFFIFFCLGLVGCFHIRGMKYSAVAVVGKWSILFFSLVVFIQKGGDFFGQLYRFYPGVAFIYCRSFFVVGWLFSRLWWLGGAIWSYGVIPFSRSNMGSDLEHQNLPNDRGSFSYTPTKTNISPEKWWLEDVFPIEIVPFLGTC